MHNGKLGLFEYVRILILSLQCIEELFAGHKCKHTNNGQTEYILMMHQLKKKSHVLNAEINICFIK